MSGFTVDVPQRDGISLGRVTEPGHAGDALGHFALRVAGSTEAAQVALDVGSEHCHTGVAEGFGQALQGHGFTGAGGAGDQAVAVGQAHGLSDGLRGRISADNELRGVRHFLTQWLIFDDTWPIHKLDRPARKPGRTFP